MGRVPHGFAALQICSSTRPIAPTSNLKLPNRKLSPLTMPLPETFWQQILTAAKTAAAPIAQRQRQDFRKAQARTKSDGSLVTQTDEWSDRQLRQALQTSFPTHGLLSEETSHTLPETDWCWVIDPLDGTTNFARGIPLWGISLGLLYKGTPIFGYVEIPPLHQAFYGYWPEAANELGCPTAAYWTDLADPTGTAEEIHSNNEALSPSHCFSFCTRSIHVLNHPKRPDTAFPCKIRMLGVATYNLLTVGLGSTMGGTEATPKIWDIAATWPIVQAAGAQWHFLSDAPIFPLKINENYKATNFPCLVVARPELTEAFSPFVRSLLP